MKSTRLAGGLFFVATLFFSLSLGMANAKDMVEGTIVSLKDSGIMVKTTVQGLTGPMEKDYWFKVGDKATMEICWGKQCDSGTAKEGIAQLSDWEYFSAEGLAPEGKKIALKTNSNNEITHLKVHYPNSLEFVPFDFVSPF